MSRMVLLFSVMQFLHSKMAVWSRVCESRFILITLRFGVAKSLFRDFLIPKKSRLIWQLAFTEKLVQKNFLH